MEKLLVLTTTEYNQVSAERIARLLLKKKLAACVSLKEICSFYNWQSQFEKNKEFEIVIKSTPRNLHALIDFLKKEISYDVPQFIFKVFDSEKNYSNWVEESVN